MSETNLEVITSNLIDQAQSYSEYREMVRNLVLENRTTGPNQSEAYLNYTKLADQRMNRWDKTTKISPLMQEMLAHLPAQTWLVITEAWCGDAGQTIPYMNKLAELNPRIQLKLILRDENPEVMDNYLTNGARSIPKLIALSPDLEKTFFVWGPKPQYLIERQKAYKEDPGGVSSKEFAEGTQLWYARDKNQSLERELMEHFSLAFGL